jgi:hypothetical protein
MDSIINLKNKMIPKLSAAFYAVKLTFHTSNINTLTLVYFVYFHSTRILYKQHKTGGTDKCARTSNIKGY